MNDSYLKEKIMKQSAVTMILFFTFFSLQLSAQHKFQWLIGTWKLKDKPVYEMWKAEDGTTLSGISFKINQSDTVVLEKINLTYSEGSYHYIPDVAENAAPVDFMISTFDDTSFVATNPAHDFPKVIRYTIVRKDHTEQLHATIEGNGKVIPYTFKRIR
jgi:hypothetical protein